ELELASPSVRTRFVDFDRDRLTAEAFGVTHYGTVVVRGLGDRVDVSERDVFRRRGGMPPSTDFLGEGAVARAISKVLSQDARAVYLLEGHGEKRMTQRGPQGVHELVTLLEREGFDVSSLDLLRDAQGGVPRVPDDAEAVLVIGPTAPLTPEEDQVLREYLAEGGGLGVFLDP